MSVLSVPAQVSKRERERERGGMVDVRSVSEGACLARRGDRFMVATNDKCNAVTSMMYIRWTVYVCDERHVRVCVSCLTDDTVTSRV